VPRCASTGTACANVDGATATTYGAHLADVGNTDRLVVTASDTGGSTSALLGRERP